MLAIDKMPNDILSRDFLDIYSRTQLDKKKPLMDAVIQKIKKSGTLEMKIQLFEQVVEIDK